MILQFTESPLRCVSFTVEPHQARALITRLQPDVHTSRGCPRDIYSAYARMLQAGRMTTIGFRLSIDDLQQDTVEAIQVDPDGVIRNRDLGLGIGDVLVLSVCLPAKLYVDEPIASHAQPGVQPSRKDQHTILFASSRGA